MAERTLKPVIVVTHPTTINMEEIKRKQDEIKQKQYEQSVKHLATMAKGTLCFISGIGFLIPQKKIEKFIDKSVKTIGDLVEESNESIPIVRPNVDVIPQDTVLAELRNRNISALDIPYANVGDVYIRHPYLKDTYIQATREQVEVFGDVFDAMSNIAQYLGVTKMSAKIQLVNEFKREFGVNGKVDISDIPIKFGAEYETKQGELNRSAASFCKEFINPKVDYDSALREAQNSGLIDIPKVQNLIQQRNPQSTGSLLKRDSVELMISKRMNDSFNIAFSLTEPHSGITVGAGYKNALEKGYTMKYELIIEF